MPGSVRQACKAAPAEMKLSPFQPWSILLRPLEGRELTKSTESPEDSNEQPPLIR